MRELQEWEGGGSLSRVSRVGIFLDYSRQDVDNLPVDLKQVTVEMGSNLQKEGEEEQP